MIHTINQVAQALRAAEANPNLRQIHGPYIDRDPDMPTLGVCATTAVAITLGGLDPSEVWVGYQSITEAVPALTARVSMFPDKVHTLFALLAWMNDDEKLTWSEQADRLDAINPALVAYPVEASND